MAVFSCGVYGLCRGQRPPPPRSAGGLFNVKGNPDGSPSQIPSFRKLQPLKIGRESTGKVLPGAFWRIFSHHPLHEVPHCLRGLVLHLSCCVGVGSERKSGVVVAQHGGDGLHVHAVLEGCGGEGMAEIMEWI